MTADNFCWGDRISMFALGDIDCGIRKVGGQQGKAAWFPFEKF